MPMQAQQQVGRQIPLHADPAAVQHQPGAVAGKIGQERVERRAGHAAHSDGARIKAGPALGSMGKRL